VQQRFTGAQPSAVFGDDHQTALECLGRQPDDMRVITTFGSFNSGSSAPTGSRQNTSIPAAPSWPVVSAPIKAFSSTSGPRAAAATNRGPPRADRRRHRHNDTCGYVASLARSHGAPSHRRPGNDGDLCPHHPRCAAELLRGPRRGALSPCFIPRRRRMERRLRAVRADLCAAAVGAALAHNLTTGSPPFTTGRATARSPVDKASTTSPRRRPRCRRAG